MISKDFQHMSSRSTDSTDGALNMRTPEYAWAQGLFLALHSMKLAFENVTGGASLTLPEAAAQLDSYRRIFRVQTTPPARHYMSNCRVFHGMVSDGPAVVSGRRKIVTGEPYVRSKHIIMLGDSGAHGYSANGNKHHSIVSDLRSHAGYPNMHDLTEIGAHPSRWLQMLIQWENAHLQYALPQSGVPGVRPRFGSDFLVIVCDAHNGLQMNKSGHTGLEHIAPSGKTVYVEYHTLMEELTHFSQVVHCYSDCAARFDMESRLDHESRALTDIARKYGLIAYSMASF